MVLKNKNSNTKFMLFNINDLIEDLSTVFTLEAGDIIATGTQQVLVQVVILKNGCTMEMWWKLLWKELVQ